MLNINHSQNVFMGADKPAKPELTALGALESSGLAALIQRAHSLEALDRDLRRSLPDAVAKNCRLANWESGKLVFHVANPVWKGKLRLHGQEILACANALGLHALEIRIKVDPAFIANETR
jgi:hypothetical protein